MAKNLVIVESPAKAQTISKFLGKDYTVKASFGHLRDLPKSKLGVDPEHDFEPTYIVSKEPRAKKAIAELKAGLKSADNVWIATDEDREGEAIGWHLTQILPIKKGQKTHYGLSACRVQSVAVRLIVEREREIRAFVPEESWSITGNFLTTKKNKFSALLSQKNGEKIGLKVQADADEIVKDLLLPLSGTVTNVTEKEKNRYPAPPFITSTLQQEASRKLGFSVKQTMAVAQQLYEGVDLPQGRTGLITYMRTDSVNLAQSALAEIRQVIGQHFGKEYLPGETRYYKGNKRAQEAHEAIRPVSAALTPDELDRLHVVSPDQLHLYRLIWQRAIACQMAEAKIKQVAADIETQGEQNKYTFHATGQVITFPGFIKVYLEGTDLESNPDDEESLLPPVKQGDVVQLEKLLPEQHFTKPPARYTESSLVKK